MYTGGILLQLMGEWLSGGKNMAQPCNFPTGPVELNGSCSAGGSNIIIHNTTIINNTKYSTLFVVPFALPYLD